MKEHDLRTKAQQAVKDAVRRGRLPRGLGGAQERALAFDRAMAGLRTLRDVYRRQLRREALEHVELGEAGA